MPTARAGNPACRLLTKKDRSDLVGYSMDDEVPVLPAKGTTECMWVHSLQESARAAIRVIALSGDVWSRSLRPQIRYAMLRPNTGKSLHKKLDKVWKELGETGHLQPDEVCPTYLMLAESRGAVRNGNTLYYSTIGSMTAAYAMSCEDGNMIAAAYGEYGIGPSIALQHGVLRLLDAAKERSSGIFKEVEDEASDGSDANGSASPSPEPSTDDESASPSPEPSPTQTDGSDSSDTSDGSDS